MTIKYQLNPMTNEVVVCSYEPEILAQIESLAVERQPQFLEITDPRVGAYLAALPTAKSLNIKKIDDDVDVIYAQAVGNRSLEYTTAEQQAQAYKDAGYTGTVPPFVASWVTASGLTATNAANNILAQAVSWRGAVEAIRANRLQAKANINAGVLTAMTQWNGFVAVIRSQLGL